MKCTRNVTDHVIWVGANDRRLNLFENLFPIPRGVSYNAYLIKDEKNALMDTVDASASEQFIECIKRREIRLPCRTAYGTGSLCQYPENSGVISRDKSSWKCKNHADDQPVL